jgi:aquaporin Z
MKHWRLYLSEALGTALLVAVGCSFVVLDFAARSPIPHLLPSDQLRRALTGFLFGSTGGAIALSPIGRESGAHINPVVSLAFLLRGSMNRAVAGGYIVSQMLGGIVGTLPLLLWGDLAQSVHFAATTLGPAGPIFGLLGETGATALLVLGLFIFVGHRSLRRFTPGLFPMLYAFLVWTEAPLSGTSTNPARSFGPDLVAHFWTGWWVDFLGPLLGLALGLLLLRLPRLRGFREEVAKLYHFHWNPHGLLSRPGPAPEQEAVRAFGTADSSSRRPHL